MVRPLPTHEQAFKNSKQQLWPGVEIKLTEQILSTATVKIHLFLSLNFVAGHGTSEELKLLAMAETCFDTSHNLMPLFAVSVYFLNNILCGDTRFWIHGSCMKVFWKASKKWRLQLQRQKLTQQWKGWQQTVGWLQRPLWLSARQASDWQPPLPPAHPVGRDGAQFGNQKQELLGESWSRMAWRDFSTLVSSCALARLSTAMAKNTLSRVSGETIKGLAEYTWHNLFVNVAARHIHYSHRLKTGSAGLSVRKIAVGRRYQG